VFKLMLQLIVFHVWLACSSLSFALQSERAAFGQRWRHCSLSVTGCDWS
jgi:hypothetical protein